LSFLEIVPNVKQSVNPNGYSYQHTSIAA
jgi:hypothetical protein